MLEALGLLNKPNQIVCVVCGNQRWSKLVTTITVLIDLHMVVVMLVFVVVLGGLKYQVYLLCPFLCNDTVHFTFFCFSALMLAHFVIFPSLTVHFVFISHREVRILQLFENIMPEIQEITTVEKSA